jgi:hypothetical protein
MAIFIYNGQILAIDGEGIAVSEDCCCSSSSSSSSSSASPQSIEYIECSSSSSSSSSSSVSSSSSAAPMTNCNQGGANCIDGGYIDSYASLSACLAAKITNCTTAFCTFWGYVDTCGGVCTEFEGTWYLNCCCQET